MDQLRIFFELLDKAAHNENFQEELLSLLDGQINDVSNIIQLQTVLGLCEQCGFNMCMFRINDDMDEHHETTNDVRAFIEDNNIDEAQNFLDFVDISAYRYCIPV